MFTFHFGVGPFFSIHVSAVADCITLHHRYDVTVAFLVANPNPEMSATSHFRDDVEQLTQAIWASKSQSQKSRWWQIGLWQLDLAGLELATAKLGKSH